MTGAGPLRVVPRRHPGRWAAAAAVVLLLALLVRAFAQGAIAWDVVGRFLTAPAILAGLVNTCIMTVAAMALGLALGVLFAVMALSPNPVLAWLARGYVWLFRGTPLLLQLLIWFNLALVFPRLGVGRSVGARSM